MLCAVRDLADADGPKLILVLPAAGVGLNCSREQLYEDIVKVARPCPAARLEACRLNNAAVRVSLAARRTENPQTPARNRHVPGRACRGVRTDAAPRPRSLPSTVHVRIPLGPRSPRGGSRQNH